MMQCHHISDAKQKGVQLSYAVAIEIEGSVHYLKMESASSYNEWIKVRASSAGRSEETHFGANLTYWSVNEQLNLTLALPPKKYIIF